jgi:cytosine/uracil/thiamine/allantoin permease
METFIILAVYLVLCIAAYKLADKKGRSGRRILIVSLLLSPIIGIIIALLLKDLTKIEP